MCAWPLRITVAMDPELPPLARRGEPVAIGVPLPRGRARRSTEWLLTNANGDAVPVQSTTLDRWGDGSIRWMLLEFRADVCATGAAAYFLSAATPGSMVAPAGPLSVHHAGDVIIVETGAAEFHVPRAGGALLARAMVHGAVAVEGASLEAEDLDGQTWSFAVRRTTVERTGPLSAVLRLDGALQNLAGEAWLDVMARLQFHAGLGSTRIELTVTNPRPAKHPGGLWDLGDPGSVLIRDLSIRFNRAGVPTDGAAGSLDRSRPLAPAGDEFAVYQDSSGGVNWQH
ncbi:MAG: hypothetical protein ABI665_20735, partial [Vicinamibacterales bacterium]